MPESPKRSLSSPFLSVPPQFPSTTILETFEAGMFLLHEAVSQLKELSSAQPPDTRSLDIATQAIWVATSTTLGPAPLGDKPPPGGAEGYRRDQQALLTRCVTTLSESESSCREILTNVCRRLDTSFFEGIDLQIDAAYYVVTQYIELPGCLKHGRDVAHIGIGTPLGNVLQIIRAAAEVFCTVLDLLESAKNWSTAVVRCDIIRRHADWSNGTYGLEEERALDK